MAQAAGKASDSALDPAAEIAALREADSPKSIIELQQLRQSQTAAIQPGGRQGTATLIELNPNINAWYLLTVDWGRGASAATYHLENPYPSRQSIRLGESPTRGLVIVDAKGSAACDLWSASPSPLDQASRSALPYVPLCNGRLYLRNRVTGNRTTLEWATDFLRDNIWGGEKIVDVVKNEFFSDAYLEKATVGTSDKSAGAAPAKAPPAASLAPAYEGKTVSPGSLGIAVTSPVAGQLALGRWYPAASVPGVHVSVMIPQAVAPSILNGHRNVVSALDNIEGSALDYLVAFDLSQLQLGFVLGTDHPRLGWSDRVPDAMRNDALPGPDGIGGPAPLVTTGMVNPAIGGSVAATFVGGFKREHGAFRYGPLAMRNKGSHYGFIEQGVVFSKLQPGLATLYVLEDGTVDMKTWTEADDRSLPQIRYARQNGVALVEPDPATKAPVPGALVAQWGPGNWSGSAEGNLRTIRAGACIEDEGERKFLIYGYFSTATPSAMERVFEAYGCRYAMLLDMNALEHTYMALYVRTGGKFAIQHLVKGMDALDKEVGGRPVPRFVGFPDNRDFFFLMPRDPRQ